ncbi:uncharacterized protein TrAtP1_006804 [Trichoderma atroviride]|uniref:Uncharacterized protein n=1 Tax=Hypocrea atroviridis (strain ATCC 20476 / IMI 206040) TaxID=452589 RepID=G9PBD8_HYPAI|nr:uncharacterized protein TRIATDRAFT_155698 [Trichoderma atroviride IMI 206040]EHK39685.1 hypothetical protein TRIATDRAFT_155698 [Trichoderma atroviride IMI 206040]UKZ65608.1 hypothetical protein TrAtP1_006804 [Trichoderma atroviride]
MSTVSRKSLPLPAPTETDETETPTELTADISRLGDEKSGYSMADDSTAPISSRARGHRSHRSQTSLLIEYFEGSRTGSSTSRKPSVRVRLTPSTSKRGKSNHNIQVTETKTSRKGSLTRRIPLDDGVSSREHELLGADDGHSVTSYASATEESTVSRNPIDIEITQGQQQQQQQQRRRRPASPLIPSNERESSYPPGNGSEISAIPTDSFLDGSPGRELGSGEHLEETVEEPKATKTKSKDRSSSKAPSDKSKDKGERKRRSKSRAGSISEPPPEEVYTSSRRRSSRSRNPEPPAPQFSAVDSSVLSSNLAPSHRSMDTRSMRSGASKSSINNPKLLETVEDAIRRLILPELSALKREQSKREGRRASFSSSASREDIALDRRRSASQKPEPARDKEAVKESTRHKERRNREARHDYDDLSVHSPSRDSLDTDFRAHDDGNTPKRSSLAKAALAGATGAAAAKALSGTADDLSETGGEKRRRRRRTESRARSQSLGRERYAEEYDDEEEMPPAPPMPLMSEINPSEMTRTSILSAESDGLHSATEEIAPLADQQRDMASPSSTPTPSRASADIPQVLGRTHANVSQGDLTALPRGKKEYGQGVEYETDEFGNKIPIGNFTYDGDPRDIDQGEDPDDGYDDGYYNTQDVPPPLRYVPYQAGLRGLSPIPSVSGFTEADGETPNRNSRGDAYGSIKSHRSLQSLDSVPGNIDASQRGTVYSDNSQMGQTAAGKAVRPIAATPNIFHPAIAAESAVASLIDGSMLDQSVLTGVYSGAGDSNLSYDDRLKLQSSRGVSPDKHSGLDHQDYEDDRQPTPGQSHGYMEYELDENGRKVPRTKYLQSPTSSEAAITAGAVGAAAAALKAAQERKQATVEDVTDDNYEPAGVFRNKSFKERAMEGWKPRNTPTHSLDRLDYEAAPQLDASSIPDQDNPMPEIGYIDSELQTNPSILNEDIVPGMWSGKATPTEYGQVIPRSRSDETMRDTHLDDAARLSREPSGEVDEWRRTSAERKRDTLLTNPYEDASPIVNPELNDNLLGSRGLGFSTGSPGFKYDEGYMSNGPNRTPDAEPKGKAINLAGPSKFMGGEDPFYASQGNRALSGMSQGMASPFYDASTGGGIDRIENKDIVALMQHLMVRDAQRSARDTEIVALLMNAAIEMRNSFRDLKELVEETSDDVIFANSENTEKLQKAINGPRPYPGSRSVQSASIATVDEIAVKKKNLWKRALQGLSAKGTNDLTRIEDMLMQLLGEVDVLKTQTAPPMSARVSTSGAGQSFDNLQPEGQYEHDKGYEPEGNSTTSHGSQSQSQGQRKFSDHRIDTVPEHEDEYEYDHPTPTAERTQIIPPVSLSPMDREIHRSGSVPPDGAQHVSDQGYNQPHSADNTPPRSDKGRKGKSSSTSWLPKISRWSGTTASTVSKALRGSGKKDAKNDEMLQSRSGSSMASRDDLYPLDTYGDERLPGGFPEARLAPPHEIHHESSAPIVPNFTTPEDPKYKAHRNSLNLMHPQPRTGQTERFRTALEHSAQDFDAPATPRSADWGGSMNSLNRLNGNANERYGNEGGDYWPAALQQQGSAPARPPKEPMNGSTQQTSPRGARVSALQKGSPSGPQGYESGYASGTGTHPSQYNSTSPKPENKNLNAALGIPSRRPSGPRAMTPKSPDDVAREERRRKRDTFGSINSHISQVSEETDTF